MPDRNGTALDTALTAALQRDRLIVVGGLILVTLLSWAWLVAGTGMSMSAIEMTQMSGMDGWLMAQAVWTPGYAALMFGMWWIMMIAMMLPSAAPTLLLFARANRAGPADSLVPLTVFAAGYLVAWGVFSAVAVALQWALEAARVLSPMLETTNVWLGAGILLSAGAWQLTPLKNVCLRHCRSPLGFLVAHWQAGRLGALQMGLRHGAYCLGCCWFLMLLLFFGGVMNLYWIAGLAVYVLAEKTMPGGHRLSQVTGVLLLAWGTWLLVS